MRSAMDSPLRSRTHRSSPSESIGSREQDPLIRIVLIIVATRKRHATSNELGCEKSLKEPHETCCDWTKRTRIKPRYSRSSVTRRLLKATNLQTIILLLTLMAIAGCSENKQIGISTGRLLGAYSRVGNGTVSSYAEFDQNGAPRAIGIVFQASALEGLPTAASDGHHCFDRNKDGKVDQQTECFASHEWIIPLPSEAARRPEMPLKWVGLNWNAHGHIPPGVYDLPHFDVHFFIEPIEKIFAIESGPCGPEFVSCDQFKIASKPLTANYMHSDFRNVDEVATSMGSYLNYP